VHAEIQNIDILPLAGIQVQFSTIAMTDIVLEKKERERERERNIVNAQLYIRNTSWKS